MVRWSVILRVALVLALSTGLVGSSVLPRPTIAGQIAGQSTTRSAATSCCCGTAEGRCCGMACCKAPSNSGGPTGQTLTTNASLAQPLFVDALTTIDVRPASAVRLALPSLDGMSIEHTLQTA